ncbi:hypothetical protein KCH_64380 [Kitasatospora cheerisanensis KCTC 2395]|uniref:Alpha/beta hydrolase fold-3 domain-containing protein n=1 Tax=Kitasatospora cheerisanensis KCTC 2395 TaxID=1348663 RepID=A0A066YJT7_9ACTN|nr:hypothetical protein KCH_64380 [Kitasatospora cheerisanensis KCTC 2395]
MLLAPWLDLALTNPDIAAVERLDPSLNRAGLVEAGRVWAGGADPADPRLSPLHGELGGLPPIEVHVGTHDILYPDTLLLRDRAGAAGTEVTLHVTPGAFHVHVLAPVPEGREARDRIVAGLPTAGRG